MEYPVGESHQMPGEEIIRGLMQVGPYTVHTGHVLGKGAYGVVFPATDNYGRIVATKRVDGTNQQKLQKVTKHLEKLRDLDHANITKMFDILQESTIIWVFMEFCGNGDLDKYFTSKSLLLCEKLRIMLDISQGVDDVFAV